MSTYKSTINFMLCQNLGQSYLLCVMVKMSRQCDKVFVECTTTKTIFNELYPLGFPAHIPVIYMYINI